MPLLKDGTIDKIFEELQNQNIVEILTETVCIDSMGIKVYPDAARKSNAVMKLKDIFSE